MHCSRFVPIQLADERPSLNMLIRIGKIMNVFLICVYTCSVKYSFSHQCVSIHKSLDALPPPSDRLNSTRL